jgi:2-polyprenyl-6-methoxyphenol hydroxylase-like FAD-dependent oxidoreductase
MRRVLVVGAGQSGLQLTLSLLAEEDYDVTLITARTADDIRDGAPMSTQGMFHQALETERAYGLNLWDDTAPMYDGLHITLSAPPGSLALEINAPLDFPGQSVDQRIKMATWLDLAASRGATIIHQAASLEDLDRYTSSGDYDLVIVAAGKGDLVRAFARDAARSPYETPQRSLAFTYVNALEPDPAWPTPHIRFNAVPGLGELFVIPALTRTGPSDILFWEGVPGGPIDVFTPGMNPADQLTRTLELAARYVPWVHERAEKADLTDAHATLAGRLTPTVRKPVAHLPAGGIALGMADVVVLNDPITGQGSNTAAKCSAAYLSAILTRGDRPFDEAWMTTTFETFWTSTAQAVTNWTNAMLGPLPEHVQMLLGTAAGNPTVARRFANGFSDPTDYADWFMTPQAAQNYLEHLQ